MRSGTLFRWRYRRALKSKVDCTGLKTPLADSEPAENDDVSVQRLGPHILVERSWDVAPGAENRKAYCRVGCAHVSDFMKGNGFFYIAGIILIGCSLSRAQAQAIQSEELMPYTNCGFADGPKIVTVDSLAPGVTARSVETGTG